MTHSIIELDGSITLFKTRSVGATRCVWMEGLYKRLQDGSLEKVETNNWQTMQLKEEIKMNEKIVTNEIEKKIQSSVDELVHVIQDEFNKQIELRRKARNKRKAAKRKAKNKKNK